MRDCVKITFLGDAMCEGRMLKGFQTPQGYDFTQALSPMKSFLSESDFVCANLETPIAFDNNNLTNELWCFCSPIEFPKALYDCGINFVSTANNHCLDRGINGINSTIRSLDKIGIKHTGVFNSKERKNEPLIIQLNGIKIGFLAYTYGTNAFHNHCYLPRESKWMVNLFQEQELSCKLSRFCFFNPHKKISRFYNFIRKIFYPININRNVYERQERNYFQRREIKKSIKYLRKNGADILIMYMHAGGQYNPKETDSTKELTRFLVSHGVDIVVGSHEHVVHGSKITDKYAVSYSLGNFIGNYGTLAEPFDKMSEYSIAWNVFLNNMTKQISKVTFSVLKTVLLKENESAVQTTPLYDLIESTTDEIEKEILSNAMFSIASKFAGVPINKIEKEYTQYLC